MALPDMRLAVRHWRTRRCEFTFLMRPHTNDQNDGEEAVNPTFMVSVYWVARRIAMRAQSRRRQEVPHAGGAGERPPCAS